MMTGVCQRGLRAVMCRPPISKLEITVKFEMRARDLIGDVGAGPQPMKFMLSRSIFSDAQVCGVLRTVGGDLHGA
jgi:hypothetical protein